VPPKDGVQLEPFDVAKITTPCENGLEVWEMKEYFKRPQDVVNAVRSLGSFGLSVSLPDLRANGEMFFRIEGRELSVLQILELLDEDRLNLKMIRKFTTQQNLAAVSCGA
jgi:hypothetical protein